MPAASGSFEVEMGASMTAVGPPVSSASGSFEVEMGIEFIVIVTPVISISYEFESQAHIVGSLEGEAN